MRIIKCFLITQFFLVIFLYSNSAFSKNLTIPSSIQFELSNSEYNKYLRRSMRAYTDGEIYGEKNIKKKYKKWVKAKILTDEKLINSEIRILGDWKDHLRPPLTSLKVKLLDDSFNGVTRFNLFLPETRNGENEVFWTLMLEYLGFPSLYTRMVEVNLNGNIYKAIFQEDATKEFLERNKLTETVILKNNDFDFYLNDKEREIYNNFFSSSYVIDNNNFLKNDIANFIASEAISLRASENFNKLVINNDFFTTIHKKYAYHGLATINRKYIYIPYKKIFVPLYYDGNVQFLPGKTDCQKKVNIEILTSFKKDFKILARRDLTKMQECVLGDIFALSKDNIKKLNDYFPNKNINLDKDLKYTNIKNKIISYLNKNKAVEENNLKKSNKEAISYSFIFNDNFYNCSLSINKNEIVSCSKIDRFSYSKLISESGRFKKLNNFKSFPINLGTFNNEIPIIELSNMRSEYILDKNATYYFVKKNIKNRDIKFLFKNSKSKLYIQGNFLNVNFDFERKFSNENIIFDSVRYDKNLLTGCANFYDSRFKDVSIKSSNMICEDSINIKNSTGNINNIEIKDSFYDALDFDFSDLKIKELKINKAFNDCLDFSLGNYEIDKLYAQKCGDKGVSVGEKSKVKIFNASIAESNIGIASKDSSNVEVENLDMNILRTCLAAYRKKREFSSAKLFVKNFQCRNFYIKTDTDKNSIITINNEI